MVTIKFAEINDVDGILTVLNENLLSNKMTTAQDILEKEGFLIHAFAEEEIKQSILHEKDHIILVAKEDKEIVGYAIGYELEQSRPDWFSRIEAPQEIISMLSSTKGLHLRHIAKRPGKRNIGGLLLQTLLDEAKFRECHYTICKIAQLPIHNKVSAHFHEKMKFKRVGMVRGKKSAQETFGLYLWIKA